MQTVLFHSTIFGPFKSRRLGNSLGVNLMPKDGKMCTFDCLYCEAGFNAQGPGTSGVPTRDMVRNALKKRLQELAAAGERVDSITFSGNGEPTLHPDFHHIVHDVLNLRKQHCPDAKVSVLSNATLATKTTVKKALKSVDNNILKLDSAVASTMLALNRPVNRNVIPQGLVLDLAQFAGQCVVQTLLVSGEHEGQIIDNTTDAEIDALINAYLTIQPREVQLYTIARQTPCTTLKAVSDKRLAEIRRHVEAAGIKVAK